MGNLPLWRFKNDERAFLPRLRPIFHLHPPQPHAPASPGRGGEEVTGTFPVFGLYPGRTRDGFAPLLLRFSYAPIEAELERSKSGANTPQIRGW